MQEDQLVINPSETTSSTLPGEMESPILTPAAATRCNCSRTENTTGETTESNDTPTEMLGQLPPEFATLLIFAGVAGIVLPGPVGTPMLIAGCVMMWPKTFRPIESWFSRRFPRMHREGVIQIKEFVTDLRHRFPDVK